MKLWRLGLALAVGLSIAAAAPAQAESNGGVRVMPLGDSITDGWNVQGGYRVGLWQRATGRYTVDFVGSGFNGPASLGDHDHEGHPGWRIDELDNNIVSWIRSANPRTVLLHIGTNDVNQDHDMANAPARLGALIDKIRANAPLAEIFVAQLTPEVNPAWEARIRTFNAAVPGVVAAKGPRTHLVDMHTGLTEADLADGVHPNEAGYDKMAARWIAALEKVPGSLRHILEPPVNEDAVLSNPQSKRCMDVAGGGNGPGSQIIIWDCHGGANQHWVRTTARELRVYGDRCLDVSNGAKIQLCNGSPGQQFVFASNGSIVNASGKCVDVTQSGTENGTHVQLHRCNGTGAQVWSVR